MKGRVNREEGSIERPDKLHVGGQIKKIRKSMVFNLFFCLLLVLVPVVLVTLYSNYESRRQALISVQNAYTTLLRSDVARLDDQLRQLQLFNVEMAFHDSDVSRLSYFSDSTETAYAKNRLYQKLSQTIQSYDCLGTLFLYLKNQEQYISYHAENQMDQEMSHAMEQYVKEAAEHHRNSAMLENWKLLSVNGQIVLVQMVYNRGVLSGAYLTSEHLGRMMLETAEELLIFPTSELSQMEERTRKDQILIHTASKYEFELGYRFSSEAITDNLSFFHRYGVWISLILIAAVAFLIFRVNRIVVRPIRFLENAMNRIRSGDVSYRITEESPYLEYQLLNETFNSTLDEVQRLKIGLYEQEIAMQNTRINNLQLQIKPHFLINSLNMVYNRLINGDFEGAKSLILYSIRYFRFMMKAGDEFITLEEELEHIRDYMKIQQLRYEKGINYEEEKDPVADGLTIPPMLLHQFVENALKYALREEKNLQISLTVEYREENMEPFAYILISDNGPGFPEELLSDLNGGKMMNFGGRNHFGIHNSLTQLRYRYKNARWKLYNKDGAMVELYIPME